MAINFPDSPSNGDTYSLGGRVWQWNGYAWRRIPDPGAKGQKGQEASKGEKGQKGLGDKGSKGEPEKGQKGEAQKGQKGEQNDKGQKGEQNDKGQKGQAGVFGGISFEYKFNDSTSDADPGTGKLALNTGAVSTASRLFIDDVDGGGTNTNIESYLRTIDDSTSTLKGHVRISNKGNSDDFAMFSITGSSTEATGYHKVVIDLISGDCAGAGIFQNNEEVIITFARTGDIGDKGNQGDKGQKGQDNSTKGQKGQQGAAQKGQKGEVGQKGQKGEIGDKGSKGEIGDKGQKGQDGNKGQKGQGDKGQKGELNDKGQKGEPSTVKGQKGEVGNKGSKGEDNSTKGQKGQDGAVAEKGQKGEVGQKGQKGEDNSTKGQKGEVEKGQKGDDNSTKGQKGEVGQKGEANDKGQKGADGAATKGQKGEVNDKGEKGEPSTIKGQKGDFQKGQKGHKGDKGQKGQDNSTKGQKGASNVASVVYDPTCSGWSPKPITVSGSTITISDESNAYGAKWIQTSAPTTGVCDGDLWYDTSTTQQSSYASISETVFNYTTSGATQTWTKPSNGTMAHIWIWGGGGCGSFQNNGVGRGGGGGACCYQLIKLSDLPSSVSIVIGKGGSSHLGGEQGESGQDSTFATTSDSYYMMAGGGSGGGSSTGGGGGKPFGTSINAILTAYDGGQGGYNANTGAHAIFGAGGGGGGNGGGGSFSSMGGNGGANRTAGSVPGGGGGSRNSGSTGSVGAGAHGQCKIIIVQELWQSQLQQHFLGMLLI